jgi:hypothetical protein
LLQQITTYFIKGECAEPRLKHEEKHTTIYR